MENIKIMEAIYNNYGKVTRNMLDETPDIILNVIVNAETQDQLRQGLYSLFLSYLTFLFEDERMIIKRKESNGFNKDR